MRSHMLKLVRNTIGKSKTFIDNEQRNIEWAYLVELHKLQTMETFHLANKLTIRHIEYHKQKMKVKLAAQLLSQSVADSLTFCEEHLQLPGVFQECAATTKFVKTFNDLFDVFNSKSLTQYGYSKHMNSENIQDIKTLFNDTINYIRGLKVNIDGKILDIVKSAKRTGFFGFIINMNNTLMLYEEICEEQKLLSYVPIYKCSQDHLEMLFSVIRSHSGCNNNPTARKFKTVFKKILSHIELCIPTTGNGIAIEDIPILHDTSANKSVDTLKNVKSCWTETMPTVQDHDYLKNIHSSTEFSLNVIVYIAGYIVHKIQKKINCIHCLKVLLTTPKEDTYHALIQIKSRGYLIYPSADVVLYM